MQTRHLLAKGRGRPPKLPEMSDKATHLQLLQMDSLRVELKKSWKIVAEVMGQMFQFPASRFRHLIEKTAVQSGKQDLEAVPDFLQKKINFNYVGPWCSALGVNRVQLLDITLLNSSVFRPECLQRGLLLELDNFRNLEKLHYSHVTYV